MMMDIWNWIDYLAKGLKKAANESQQNYQQVHAYINGHDQETLNQVTEIVHDELEKVKSDVTQAKQDAAQAVANAESAKVTIDTSNIHQIKKPSEYPEGFSYELKEVSALIPDRSNLDSTAQDGSQGIVTTEACKSYARQTLKVIDSQRPLTFIRNGRGDSWYPFELVTT